MLESFTRFFKKKEPAVERPVKISCVVQELLAGEEVSGNFSPEEMAVVDRINKLKGTQFQGSPGHLSSVVDTSVNMARALGRNFDLNLLHLVMDGKVRRNDIPVDLDNPEDVDRAWNRYFDKISG